MNNLYRFLMGREKTSILHPRKRMLATFAAILCMITLMPLSAWAQHPFTLTTPDDVTNHTETLYWIESYGATGFYAIPHTNNSNVSTTNMPNLKALWYFMDAGTDNSIQYYYIVNHNTGYYLKLDGTIGNDNTIKIASFGSGGDAFKFSIGGSEGEWILYPKSGNGNYWVNKKSGNVPYDRYLKSSNYSGSPDANSKWDFVAENSVTWTHPFTNSTNEEKHYYNIHNATANGSAFFMSIDNASDPYATVSNVDNSKRIWYFMEADSDNTIPNLKYYYIVNAITGKYLKFTGTANGSSQASSLQLYEHDGTETGEAENRFQFMVLNAIGTNYSAYSIMPKLEISYYYNQNASLSPSNNYSNSLINDMKIGIYNDRGTDNNYAHWMIEETVFVWVEAPTITNNYDGTISLSTTATGATIYYTTNGDTPDNTSTKYSSDFSLGDATVIKAIAYIGSDYSDVSIYNVPKYTTPTISFDNSTSQITITSEGTVYYNTGDGSQPAPTPSSGTLYSAPFTVSSDITVKAIATHAGYLNSDVATWPTAQGDDYSRDYLTFRILTGGTISWKAFGSNSDKTIEYSINDGAWTSITSTSEGVTFDVQEHDVVRFKGLNSTYASDRNVYSGFDGGTATYDISGNIMSLIYGDNFIGETTLSGSYNFCSLFKQSKVVSAENLILPATSLTECCYRAMFSKCTTLEVAPALPATTLGAYCYYYMFEECAITSAPELLAPTLASNCYGNMFKSCTSLNYILCLAVDKSASGCLTNWVSNVSPTGTFVKEADVEWATGASGIPSGWVVNNHLAAPEDPVITCDGEFITITCQTYGASIYYRLGQEGSYSLYSLPIAINENTVVEAYAVKNELQSNIVSENCIAIKSHKFAGMELTPGPLYYGSNGYEIKDGWNYDSYNSIYGKTVGSTYFNFIELGQLFESSVFSTSDGDIEKVLDPLDGWRVPTNAEWASILGTTRSGSTVNGSSNKHYAMIQLTGVTHANADTPSGLLIFPDGETITGVALSNMDNTTSNTGITASQLDDYLSQGCIFLPGSGYYDGSLQTWGNEHYYWSSTENNSSTGYDLSFGPSNTISSDDNKNKETCYFPVYLVKDAADEATRLLRTWTYNNHEVELPYSVNAIDGHSGSYARGTFYFTTDVKIKESQPTYLWFQHADQSANIYVNDSIVETHWGGYNAFFTDITNYVHGGTNNIKVALCNTKRNTIAPYTGDFNMNATLGEVKLISSPVVPDPDYGYDGFHITSTVSSASATITVKTSVPTSATLTCSIKGDNCDYSYTQTGTGEITFTTTITNPHLWNGTLDPYLYDVTLTIAKDGVVYHQFKRGYGLRFYEYVINETVGNETYTGFLLNGSPYLLRGVCMHHDLEGKANALTAADIDNDFEILKELGCNFVRLAHYPHPKEVYDRCDKIGIIVQTEAPCVNDFQSTMPQDYYDHLYIQYEDMVRQHFNHPCIMFWGLGNEIKLGTNEDPTIIAKTRLEAYRTFIKNIDSERWVGYVVDNGKNNPSSSFGNPDMDWFGCNIYVGWYSSQDINDPTSQLNARKKNIITDLNKPLAFSEYGCGGTPSCHSDDFMTTTTRGNNPRHDIEYQMWLHEGHIAAIKNFPELLFTSQWQLFDIAVSSRNEGYIICLDGENTSIDDNLRYLNNKGLVERDHKTKKDPFYLYKAWWNQTDKFVHICGKDYEKLTNRVIKCYTNDGSTLTLFVNDVEIKTATVENNIATFTATDFNPGDVIRVDGATTNDTFTFTNYSEDYVFTTDGYWNEATNWTPAGEPTSADNVTINAACTIPATYTAQANNITIGENGSLTIADGGQLYHNNEGVTATVQKIIAARTVDNVNKGWAFIASPIVADTAPSFVANMTETAFDLYRFNQSAYLEWENYLVHNTTDDPFLLENGQGYLYSNESTITLGFAGAINPSNTPVSVSVDSITGAEFAGWNLVGNPFTFNAFVDKPYYKMNEDGSAILATEQTSGTIAPCTGIMVHVGETGQSITFSKEPLITSPSNGNVSIAVVQANDRGASATTLDNAIVSFNEGSQLGKFYFGEQNANIYLPQGGEEYAIAYSDKQGEMPLNFKANENGAYTLTVNPEGVEVGYLHLIDNMTGADVDLLANPSYSFNAKVTDYESRFKLVFAAADEADGEPSEAFAFISNGNLIVSGTGTLQVIDMLGHQLLSRDIHSAFRIPHSSFPSGVYVLRLIDGNDVKTQKIVVK